MNDNNLLALRHSAEHVLTQAVLRIFPKVKMAMGPATDDGFYFDFDSNGETISEKNFSQIEQEMHKIIKADLPIVKKEISLAEAKKLFKDNQYKQEWLKEIEIKKETPIIYATGEEFLDLCSGPHLPSTGKISAFKLLSIAGAYWHGSEKNKMLTRIYGTAFPTKDELKNYLQFLEEAKKSDHRTLGKSLDLFSTNLLTGPGLILWHPKLAMSRNIVEQFWKDEHIKNGYQLVYTPHIASMDMFVKTRHYLNYIDSMFPLMLHENIEGESQNDYTQDEQLKPMNCPNHVQIFKTDKRSYRELPLRMAELGTVYRYERAGVLHGLTRVRGFTQDDSHIFCTPDQVIEEIVKVIQLTRFFYKAFGFSDYQAYLSTRPEKYLGSIEMWDFAESSLVKALNKEDIPYKIDKGQGVFYGPKIDSKIKDSLGREWQLGTIQFDFNLPSHQETSEEEIELFFKLKTFRQKYKTKENLAKYLKQLGRGLDVKFVDKDGLEKQVVMIHRTILGSMERFFGVLIEHYKGAFPLWLAPTQVLIIPITDAVLDYSKSIVEKLKEINLRVELDNSGQSMQKRIRNAEMQKIPYIVILGEKELKESKLAVRGRGRIDLGTQTLEEFMAHLKSEIEEKR